jgi:hypothetical protein
MPIGINHGIRLAQTEAVQHNRVFMFDECQIRIRDHEGSTKGTISGGGVCAGTVLANANEFCAVVGAGHVDQMQPPKFA